MWTFEQNELEDFPADKDVQFVKLERKVIARADAVLQVTK